MRIANYRKFCQLLLPSHQRRAAEFPADIGQDITRIVFREVPRLAMRVEPRNYPKSNVDLIAFADVTSLPRLLAEITSSKERRTVFSRLGALHCMGIRGPLAGGEDRDNNESICVLAPTYNESFRHSFETFTETDVPGHIFDVLVLFTIVTPTSRGFPSICLTLGCDAEVYGTVKLLIIR